MNIRSISRTIKITSLAQNKATQFRLRQLVLICWPLEMIRKELANYVHSVFYQSSQAIHAIPVPLTPIFASFVPSVVS